jgi:two-component system cell cycle response regulator DivK
LLFHDLLDAHGYRILQTKDGMEALDIAREHHPDLILMDIQLPGMDGLAATRAIRALSGEAARVPIVGISGRTDARDEEAARAAGMNAFLGKPVSPAALAQAVGKLAR